LHENKNLQQNNEVIKEKTQFLYKFKLINMFTICNKRTIDLFRSNRIFNITLYELNNRLNLLANFDYLLLSSHLCQSYLSRSGSGFNFASWLPSDKGDMMGINLLEKVKKKIFSNKRVSGIVKLLIFLLNRREKRLNKNLIRKKKRKKKFSASNLACINALLENLYHKFGLNRIQRNIRKLKISGRELIIALLYAIKCQRRFYKILHKRRKALLTRRLSRRRWN